MGKKNWQGSSFQKVKHPWLEEEFQNALYKIS